MNNAAVGESRGRPEDMAETLPEPLKKKPKTVAANGSQPTVRCRHWARGSCRLEDKCNFAHVGEPGQALCRHWARGKCNLGQECKFSHYGEPGQGPTYRPAMPFNSGYQAQPQNSYFQPQFGQAGGFPPQGMFQQPAPQQFQPPFGGGFQQFGAAPPRSSRGAGGATPCRHFARGFCERGESCQFTHVPSSQGREGGAQGQTLCRHHARGFCSLGGACKFLHE
jgi:hypothetical protein